MTFLSHLLENYVYPSYFRLYTYRRYSTLYTHFCTVTNLESFLIISSHRPYFFNFFTYFFTLSNIIFRQHPATPTTPLRPRRPPTQMLGVLTPPTPKIDACGFDYDSPPCSLIKR